MTAARAAGAVPTPATGVVRWLWLGLGWLAVGVAAVGAVVPGLPTTGFLILAASCFARSSPRFERWVLSLPKVGSIVADYRAGLGMPRRAKAVAIGTLAVAVGASAGFAIGPVVARAAVLVAGVVGVWFIVSRIPTREVVVARS